jgi:hypothetical protein
MSPKVTRLVIFETMVGIVPAGTGQCEQAGELCQRRRAGQQKQNYFDFSRFISVRHRFGVPG